MGRSRGKSQSTIPGVLVSAPPSRYFCKNEFLDSLKIHKDEQVKNVNVNQNYSKGLCCSQTLISVNKILLRHPFCSLIPMFSVAVEYIQVLFIFSMCVCVCVCELCVHHTPHVCKCLKRQKRMPECQLSWLPAIVSILV